jgi:DNA-binding transcriptional ArsR family regulator
MTVDDVLAALADATRRRLLDLVAESGETTATELTGQLPVTRQALVQHLAVLEGVGLVVSRRVGRERRYRVRSEQLTATAGWMNDLAAQWDRRLAVIKSVAESKSNDPPPSSRPVRLD